MIMDKIKGMLKSWTIWFNSLAAAVLAGLPSAAEYIPQLAPYVADHWYKILGAIVVGANLLLRFKTNTSLSDKK